MVEDPIQMGLLGYGPSVANPHTGEIVHARTVMYPGILKLTLKRAYDDIIMHKFKQAMEKTTKEDSNQEPTKSEPSDQVVQNLHELKHVSQMFDATTVEKSMERINKDLKQEDHRLVDHINREYTDQDIQKQLRFIDQLTKNNFYPTEMFNFNSLIESELDKVLAISKAKPWSQLASEQKNQLMDILMPYAWIPTMIHELGHNLGMRHNFSGSNDQVNFYQPKELKEMGVKRPVKYSSIMDYGYRTINELPIMGKYDIAALRFAYGRKVELNDGKVVDHPVEDTAQIKDYMFCTDDHVYLNATCNRFDEGTNLTEIVDFTINSYESEYTHRNLRGDRRDFSSYGGTLSYLSRIKSKFHTLRLTFEQYETYKYRFNLDDSAPEWEQIPFLKEVKLATEKAGKFLIDVVKTPTVTCLIQDQQSGGMLVAPLKQLTTFDPYATNCFEAKLNPRYLVAGQTGKAFEDQKYITNPYSYIDQIDVRGIWVDKLLALNTLFDRMLGITNFDKYSENFLTLPALRPELTNLIGSVLTNEVQSDLTFVTNPELLDQLPPVMSFKNVGYDLISLQAHKIEVPLHPLVKRYFGLRSNSYFQVEMVDKVINAINDAPLGFDLYQDIVDQMSVHKYIRQNKEDSSVPSIIIDGRTYMAGENNTVASKIISKLRQHNLAVELKDEEKMLPIEHVSLYQNILTELNYIHN